MSFFTLLSLLYLWPRIAYKTSLPPESTWCLSVDHVDSQLLLEMDFVRRAAGAGTNQSTGSRMSLKCCSYFWKAAHCEACFVCVCIDWQIGFPVRNLSSQPLSAACSRYWKVIGWRLHSSVFLSWFSPRPPLEARTTPCVSAPC